MKLKKGNFILSRIFFSFKSCLEIDCNNDCKDPSDEKV